MADNGKIIRNGAEIQIDENGNVVARPAAGQNFIVEDDAVVGSLEADSASIAGQIFDFGFEEIDNFNEDLAENDDIELSIDELKSGQKLLLDITRCQGDTEGSELHLTFDGLDNGNYGYKLSDDSSFEDQDEITLFRVDQSFPDGQLLVLISIVKQNALTISPISSASRFGRATLIDTGGSMGSFDGPITKITLTSANGDLSRIRGRLYRNNTEKP